MDRISFLKVALCITLHHTLCSGWYSVANYPPATAGKVQGQMTAWPLIGGTQPIRHCYKTGTDYQVLHELLTAAAELWTRFSPIPSLRIIPDDHPKAGSQTIYRSPGVRYDALRISLGAPGSTSGTSLGYIVKSEGVSRQDWKKHHMTLVPDHPGCIPPARSDISIVAHELGMPRLP